MGSAPLGGVRKVLPDGRFARRSARRNSRRRSLALDLAHSDGYANNVLCGYGATPVSVSFFGVNIGDPWERAMRYRAKLTPAVSVVLFLLLAFLTSSGSSQNQSGNPPETGAQSQTKSNVVYVCACLKTKSCFCLTEAKMEGPCACGTEGGPPLKAVPKDSSWAKENRDALAK